MKTQSWLTHFTHMLPGVMVALAISAAALAKADTIWNGPNTNFFKSSVSDNKEDVITPQVSLNRSDSGTLFNDSTSPTPDTVLWAFGTTNNYLGLDYETMDFYRNGDLMDVLLNKPMVMQLVNEKIYIAVTFTNWAQHHVGSFGYTRATAPLAPPTPSVSITNPVGGAVFAVPANLNLKANATVSSGTVTNVAFFANATPVGSVTNAPFNVTSSSLGSGSYSLTAVATAAGISATSAVVSVTVVTPVTVSLSAPKVTNGNFTFSYNANPGLTYLVQNSSNLTTWLPVMTNVAASSPVLFSNGVAGSARFYRVGRLPNP